MAYIVSTSVGGILQGMRVLVVEDEARLALLLKRGLEEEGYAVDVRDGATVRVDADGGELHVTYQDPLASQEAA